MSEQASAAELRRYGVAPTGYVGGVLGGVTREDAARAAVGAYLEMCDLDFRSHNWGKWPRTAEEAGEWALHHGRALVEWAAHELEIDARSIRIRALPLAPFLRNEGETE